MSEWDELKRVREEEYFLKEEREKVARLKKGLALDEKKVSASREMFSRLEKAESPITGAPMYKATIAGFDILDCPEEKTLFMTYGTLQTLMKEAEKGNKTLVELWQTFLRDNPDGADEE